MPRQRTAAPAPRCSFSDLPSPVAAHIFSLLSNDDRLPVLDVCTAWHAIIDAGGPALWPTASIKGFQAQATPRIPYHMATADSGLYQSSLAKAGALSLRLRSLLVDAEGAQPEMILCILAVIPAVSLVHLHFQGRCPGPLPVVLQRFHQLQRVDLTGDASRVSWEGPGGIRLAGMVCSLDLAPVTVEDEDGFETVISDHLSFLPGRAARLGGALSQLMRLGIEVHWRDEERSVPALCGALPSLQAFSLCARGVANVEQAASVVELLVSLPQHVAVDLTVTRAIDINREYDEYWEDFVQLPAGLFAIPSFTELCLGTGIELPPDWLQLSRLRALTLHDDSLERIASIEHPFPSLTQLQLHMSSGNVAPDLTIFTSLQSLRLESCGDRSCSLPASLPALTALTCLELLGFKLPTVPAPVPDMTSLRTLSFMPSPDQLPAGRYLEGLQELHWTRFMSQSSDARHLPPSLALATCLERLEVSEPHHNSSNVSLLAALPALRAVTLVSCSNTVTELKHKLQELRPDLAVTHLQY
ncbi:hypothetical protein D9Q98_009792 [Chlorella vulgaris]|uniref:F-box domain-containing protein n=1 Tax=Chlorella vulgaris TaxID=3077 RepID=A0A9D4TF40_CHLVU|nr:hypothetical protein D9Q98_009792 [Chlorella vulgaris]